MSTLSPCRSLLLLAMVGLALAPAIAQQAKGKKYALLVGVNRYQDADRLPTLRYAVKDASALRPILQQAGYEVVLLTDDEGRANPSRSPTKENIERHLKELREKCRKNGGETFLAAFAGHGLQFTDIKDVFFCPRDGLPDSKETDTLVSLTAVCKELVNSTAQVKVLLVDACRNDPKLERGARSFDARSVQVPDGVAALFSCSAGQKAQEHDKLQHGVFFYHVLQELRGAGSTVKGKVTFNKLADHVMEQVPASVKELLRSAEAEQTPNQVNNIRGLPVLLTLPEMPLPKETKNALGMTLVRIDPGLFHMGSPSEEPGRNSDEERHPVEITELFHIGKHEVTVGQFRQFVKAEDYRTEAEKDSAGGYGYNAATGKLEGRKKEYTWKNVGWAQTDNHPVVNVTWNDAQAFCAWLSRQEGKKYDLPTEAQWERCCRAGSKARFSHGPDEDGLRSVANIADAALLTWHKGAAFAREWNDGYPFTSPVGTFAANGWGLHDMHGNVWEWCRDWYDENYYGISPRQDPPGPPQSREKRVIRGGSWLNSPQKVRCAVRGQVAPTARDYLTGFRVVRLR